MWLNNTEMHPIRTQDSKLSNNIKFKGVNNQIYKGLQSVNILKAL